LNLSILIAIASIPTKAVFSSFPVVRKRRTQRSRTIEVIVDDQDAATSELGL